MKTKKPRSLSSRLLCKQPQPGGEKPLTVQVLLQCTPSSPRAGCGWGPALPTPPQPMGVGTSLPRRDAPEELPHLLCQGCWDVPTVQGKRNFGCQQMEQTEKNWENKSKGAIVPLQGASKRCVSYSSQILFSFSSGDSLSVICHDFLFPFCGFLPLVFFPQLSIPGFKKPNEIKSLKCCT